jgi:AcrR family transcriptional regulator
MTRSAPGTLTRNLPNVKVVGCHDSVDCVAVVPRPRPAYGLARDALLAAVIRTVARVGLRGLTYRAVAAEAGVSYGAVSHHFGSRDALIGEALERSAVRAIHLASLETKAARIEDFVSDLPAAVAVATEDHAFQFELALESTRHPSLRPAVRNLYSLYQKAISAELTRIGAPHDAALARLIFAALDGLVFQQVIGVTSQREVGRSIARLQQVLGQLRDCRSEAVDP